MTDEAPDTIDETRPPPNERDYRIERGGKPGRYFFYRPNEVLVLGSDKRAVAKVLGPEREYDIVVNDRTQVRRTRREAR